MKETIDRIRAELDELEKNLPSGESDRVLRDFSAFELPEIVKDIVDYLMPLLTPYEAAFYWNLFRQSVLSSGNQYVRASARKFRRGVIRSSYSKQSKQLGAIVSEATVRQVLRRLEKIGAIRIEGDPNRDGTLYKILIPEEIGACRDAMKARQAEEDNQVEIAKEVDFYNVRENRHKIFERDGYVCRYCSKQLTRFTATLDHVTPVSEGGDNSYDNLVTACLSCNSKKTGKTLGDFLADHNPSSK